MDITLLDTLKYKVATGKVLADVFEYFFDHFGEDLEFLDLGVAGQDKYLEELLGIIGGQILKTDVVVLKDMRLALIEEYDFIHGGLMLGHYMVTVIYFRDIRQGIAAMVNMKQRTGRTDFYRFSAELLTGKTPTKPADFKH